MYKLFMTADNATEGFLDKKHSFQGFSVYGDRAFMLFDSGVCAVYDLISRGNKPLGVFRLGSFNPGVPDRRYKNHANDCMFGDRLPGEKIPLLYVTAGNSGEADEKGYIAYCAVEQIRCRDGEYSAETVQRIYYRDDGIEATGFRSPGWGWPASLVDTERGRYYMFSSRRRTKAEFSGPDNRYIVTRFSLPAPGAGDVTLTPSDIEEQFELPFEVMFTQGGTLRDGKIYYAFGCTKPEYPDKVYVADTDTHAFSLFEDFSVGEMGTDELECCAFYGDRILVNAQSGRIFEICR